MVLPPRYPAHRPASIPQAPDAGAETSGRSPLDRDEDRGAEQRRSRKGRDHTAEQPTQINAAPGIFSKRVWPETSSGGSCPIASSGRRLARKVAARRPAVRAYAPAGVTSRALAPRLAAAVSEEMPVLIAAHLEASSRFMDLPTSAKPTCLKPSNMPPRHREINAIDPEPHIEELIRAGQFGRKCGKAGTNRQDRHHSGNETDWA